ncbi:hypothetical protein CRV15_35135 (plasmid) [Streptomyces clavuligerus]|uniref:Integrin_alpha2 domain-containing protein n=4 Tax=Streptomyces clavuligerus TaxID=1901 RepID=D5SLY2_STRCL|nr:DUF11 domain-containing protein [Streptomyces clavuligerus]EFG04925.1 Integrin_alpha2 domain-containing protein [Streptomyces clavuligerus]MBY6306638.1 hypothetical protein [Streptomyces clavuligerus]QCS10755.1 hypothetical protein CRV15_35135 [Streptomyces clavuligerus]QPJ97210.1 hypothetical protein GE265_29350 [Streptomyces clavuligerus]WDN57468.1 DUF11 domain-containing protein [Streptomyces clavuligerus]
MVFQGRKQTVRAAAGAVAAGLVLWAGQPAVAAPPTAAPAVSGSPVRAADTFVLTSATAGGTQTLIVPKTVTPGESIDLVASYTNTTDHAVEVAGMDILFPKPSDAQVDVNDSSYTDAGGGYTVGAGPRPSEDGSLFYVTWRDIPAGATASTRIGITLRTASSGPVEISATGGGSGIGRFDLGKGTINAAPAAADLGVSLTATPKGLGTLNASFTATVTNHGPADTTAAKLRFTYSPGFHLPQATGCTTDPATRTATCDLGPLAGGANVTRTLALQAGALTIGLSLPVTATVTDIAPADPAPGNDTATHSCAALTALLVIC